MQKITEKTRRRIIRLIALCLTFICLSSAMAGIVSAEQTEAVSGEKSDFKYAGVRLCLGGMAFGVKLCTEGVLVIGFANLKTENGTECPADKAGIALGDVILSANGTAVSKIADLSGLIEQSQGKEISLAVKRKDKSLTLTLIPIMSDGVYKGGMWLKDSAAGIGTVTFFDPESSSFGGLGHGICDSETGVIMPLKRGIALEAGIGGVVMGKAGHPGELKGYFKPEKLGSVLKNTSCGVFGAYAELPEQAKSKLPVASRNEVKEGKAELLCTLGDDGVKAYEVSISRIERSSHDNKSFVVTVTDKDLMARTGGIVQGMSGSPIIQNGKIIGAVTHV